MFRRTGIKREVFQHFVAETWASGESACVHARAPIAISKMASRRPQTAPRRPAGSEVQGDSCMRFHVVKARARGWKPAMCKRRLRCMPYITRIPCMHYGHTIRLGASHRSQESQTALTGVGNDCQTCIATSACAHTIYTRAHSQVDGSCTHTPLHTARTHAHAQRAAEAAWPAVGLAQEFSWLWPYPTAQTLTGMPRT